MASIFLVLQPLFDFCALRTFGVGGTESSHNYQPCSSIENPGASKIQIAERNSRNMKFVRSEVECFKHTPRQKKEEEKEGRQRLLVGEEPLEHFREQVELIPQI